VNDEFRAQHFQLRILLFSMRDVAIGEVRRIWRCMKRIARRVHAYKSHPPCIASSNACLPLADIGGLPSVPRVVRSPVVKNTTAAKE